MSDLARADEKMGIQDWLMVWSIHQVAMLWSLPPQAVELGTMSRYIPNHTGSATDKVAHKRLADMLYFSLTFSEPNI